MKSNIKYYGALQKYTLSSDYPSNEIYLHIEDVDAIPIEWIRKQLKNCDNIHAELYIRALLKQWEKENEINERR